MVELWQLYDEQGRPVPNKGATADDVLDRGLLHAASHVWIWRKIDGKVHILLQKRDATKQTWPNFYDISAAGHIDLGEDPISAAVREAQEEIGLVVAPSDLRFISVDRRFMKTPDGRLTENEVCWLYALEVAADSDFSLDDGEVDSIIWKDIEIMKSEVATDSNYVPHGDAYYNVVFKSIERLSSGS